MPNKKAPEPAPRKGKPRVPPPVPNRGQPRDFTPVKRKILQSRPDTRDFVSQTIDDVYGAVTRAASNPIFFLLFVSAVGCIVAQLDTKGPLIDLINKISNVALRDFLKVNLKKLLGFLVFLPTIFTIRRDYRVLLVLVSLSWVLFIPESSVYEYIVQSFCLLIYFQARRPLTKIIAVSLVVAAYALGFMVLNTATVKVVPVTRVPTA